MSVAVLGRRSCGVGDPWAVRRRDLEGVVVAFKAAVGRTPGLGAGGTWTSVGASCTSTGTARHTGRGRPVRKRRKAPCTAPAI